MSAAFQGMNESIGPKAFVVIGLIVVSVVAAASPTLPRQGTHGIPPRVVFVKPVFTITPYYLSWISGNGSFYSFYPYAQSLYHCRGCPNPEFIQAHLNWLSAKVLLDPWNDLAGPSLNTEFALSLFSFLSENFGATLLTDIDVDGGALFDLGGTRKFDVVVLGHEEYVTDAEYGQFQRFVSTGGRLVATDGNTFYARVNYSASTDTETYVVGHGWEFNGTHVWPSSLRPFDTMSTNWFGSVFEEQSSSCPGDPQYRVYGISYALADRFGPLMNKGKILTNYGLVAWEVNTVTNFTSTVAVATFYGTEDTTCTDLVSTMKLFPPVEVYCHSYRAGASCSFGVFGEYFLQKGDVDAEYLISRLISGDV